MGLVDEYVLMCPVAAQDDWLKRFHAGHRTTLETCYREHFRAVDGSVGRILSGADRETVVQELFLRILSNEALRRRFSGGAFSAWVTTVARNQAIDFARRRRREQAFEEDLLETQTAARELERKSEARFLIERFCTEQLPEKWQPMFQARFLEQLDQREAAARLGIARTTLAYQELRARHLLKRYLLGSKS